MNNFLSGLAIILASISISIGAYWIKIGAQLFKELRVTKNKSENSINLQREAYFREVSGQKLADILNSWTSMLTNDSTFKNIKTNKFEKMIKECLMYGSEDTVNILSTFMQYIYTNSKDDNFASNSMLLLCNLICSLKHDFTGYNMEPLDLIKTKVNDFDENDNATIFTKAEKFAKQLIDKNKK